MTLNLGASEAAPNNKKPKMYGKPWILFPPIALVMMLSACGGGNSASTPTSGTPPSTDPTQAFIAKASAGGGTLTLTSTPAHATLMGCLVKGKTSDPRTLGSAAFLTNTSGAEYRVTHFTYELDTSGLLPGESAESDIGFTILPDDQVVALNSGEEILMAHRYDTSTINGGVIDVALPAGGVAVLSGQRLSVGSVTGIYPQAGGGAVVVADSRLAGGTFMQVCYEADLTRADLMSANRVASYRSPYRDRSYVADPARVHSPFTDFKNTTNAPIKVYGVGVFLSNLSDAEPSTHAVNVLVNGTSVDQISLPPHTPGTTTPLYPMILPESITLNPGDVIAVRGKVTPQRAIVFDFASYIFADQGLTPTNEQLDVLNADLNGDGYNDIVDIDALGSIWVSLRFGGLQSTEQEWARSVKGAPTLAVVPSQSAGAPLIVQATNASGICLNMQAVPSQGLFILDYCQTNGSPSTASDIWGDFNGDGWIDRMRVDPSALTYSVALGGPNGLAPQQPWVYGYGAVDKMFVSDANGDGMDDIEAEWGDATGFRCGIWMSSGKAFNLAPCN